MTGFLYSVFLKLLYPTSLALLLLGTGLLLWWRRRDRMAKWCLACSVLVSLVCGNAWLTGSLTRHLERQYPPFAPALSSPASRPDTHTADAILILGGGIQHKISPRQTVEVGEAGDRMLYGAYLLRSGYAPKVLCTSGIATGGIAPGPAADIMAELLIQVGVPESAILREGASRNTYEHGRNLNSFLNENQIKTVLLVTSALHMPRSMAVFRKQCPGVAFIPAPTDYRAPDSLPSSWYRHLPGLIPTPSTYVLFSEVTHEYLGIAYYKLRGWI